MGKEQIDSPKILYVQGYPVKVKYSSANNRATLKSIQSIILGEAEENQIFARFPDIHDNGNITADQLG